MATKKPAPVKLTEEERLRDERVLTVLTKGVGGYHVDSVASLSHCSSSLAHASLNRLIAQGKVELYEGSCHTRLYRIKREKEPFTWGLR